MVKEIIDVHAHIYPQAIAPKAVVSIENFYEIRTDYKEGTVEALNEICQRANVVKVVVHSVATSPKQVESINNYIAETAAKNSLFIPFATLHPDMSIEQIKAEYNRIKEMGMRGIKLHPDFQRFEIDGESSFKLLSCLDGGLPILTHAGDKRYKFSNPNMIINAAKKFPNIRFIAAHFGGYSEWEYAENYIDVPNVFFDTSSSLAFLDKDRAVQIINYLGEDRFMFGSDFPMWSAADEIVRLKKLGLPQEVEDNILYYNAAKFFNL